MTRAPYYEIMIRWFYALLGRLGYLIGSVKLINVAIVGMERQNERLR